MLWGRAAARCSMANCRIELVMDETETDDAALIGEECHIVGSSLDGARGRHKLPQERRHLYGNLILLCRNDHKMIDDNPRAYTVARLHKIKRDHESWVKKNVAYDERRQEDDEYYAGVVERWERACQVDNWEAWSSWVLGGGPPELRIALDKSLGEFRRWLFTRIWPGRYRSLERSLQNFRIVLQDFQETFREDVNKRGETLVIRQFYKIDQWDPELYGKLLKKYECHVDLVQDLMLELSRAANWVCDEVRRHLTPSYRLEHGRLAVEYGPTTDLKMHRRIPQYSARELRRQISYPGFEAFKSERALRDLHFGPQPVVENRTRSCE